MNFKKLDALAARMKEKEITIPTDFIGAAAFLVLGIVLFLVMPGQVPVAEDDVVNGRVFPTMLLIIMILCCILLLGQNLIKMKKNEPVNKVTFNLLTEVKALIIMGILVLTYVICEITDLFVAGSVFCAVSFLVYFRCSRKLYYVITIGIAAAIWAAFRFALGVRF